MASISRYLLLIGLALVGYVLCAQVVGLFRTRDVCGTSMVRKGE
jgi:hypothetical protein